MKKIVAGGVDLVVPVQDEGHDLARLRLALAAEQGREPARSDEDVIVHAHRQPRGGLAERAIAQLAGCAKDGVEDQPRPPGEALLEA
jgi:hypothetical protein